MALFNGVDIFGAALKMNREISARDEQRNAYPAVDGEESLDMGHRGRDTVVQGWLYGVDRPTLNLAVLLFESYHDGRAYTLVDTDGNAWSYVKLIEFKYESKVGLDPVFGLMRRYSARFHHLS